MTTTADTLPVTLRDAREDAALTQDELAAELGVPRATLYNWESGRCLPSPAAHAALAAALGVPAGRLLVG